MYFFMVIGILLSALDDGDDVDGDVEQPISRPHVPSVLIVSLGMYYVWFLNIHSLLIAKIFVMIMIVNLIKYQFDWLL